ncbi:MAG: hypothetical protein E6Q59_04760 [Nitrosomonas sp.]|nr:MAG: hypothetical protein BVN30_10455 [Proteobacteria bacterium ST_bin16]TXI39548.1 MAG: hypothetical protein E6Q59_04760 [Nitrosomonas sp.]
MKHALQHPQNSRPLRFFIHQAGIGLNPSVQFGTEDSGFVRLNIRAPKQTVLRVLEKIRLAMHQWYYVPKLGERNKFSMMAKLNWSISWK